VSDIKFLSDEILAVSNSLVTISDNQSGIENISTLLIAVSNQASTNVVGISDAVSAIVAAESNKTSAILFLSNEISDVESALITEASNRVSDIKFISDEILAVSNSLSDTESEQKVLSDLLFLVSDRLWAYHSTG